MSNEIIARESSSNLQSGINFKKLLPVFWAVMLGILVVGAVGFAPGMAHEAAHDTRHVMIFPCH